MGLYDLNRFVSKFEGLVFYVGLLKGLMGWFPLARVSGGDALDTLVVSRDRDQMVRMCESAVKTLKNVEAFDVSELLAGQVFHRAARYNLDKIELMD